MYNLACNRIEALDFSFDDDRSSLSFVYILYKDTVYGVTFYR